MENSSGQRSSIPKVICSMLPQNYDDKMVLGDATLLVNTCPIVPTNFVCSDSDCTTPLDKTDRGILVFWENKNA